MEHSAGSSSGTSGNRTELTWGSVREVLKAENDVIHVATEVSLSASLLQEQQLTTVHG